MRFLLLMMAAAVMPAAQTPAHGAEPGGAPLADIVIEGFDRPLRMRLVVLHNGKAWREHFAATNRLRVQTLFDQLDADGDRRLTSSEAKRLPSPRSLAGSLDNDEVYVAFNFLVLDENRDGGVDFDELSHYVTTFSGLPIRMSQAIPQSVAGTRNLFDLLDLDRDNRLTAGERSNLDVLLNRDRDGNRVLTKDELQSVSASVFGPEYFAVPLTRSAAGRSLSFRLAPPEDAPADVVVHVRFVDSTSSGGGALPTMQIELNDRAKREGIRADADDQNTVVLQYQRSRVELRLAPPVFRRDVQLRQALVREFEAAAQRAGGQVSAADDLPPALALIFPVADGDANKILQRDELDRCLDGFIAANMAAAASRLRLAVFEQRRGLATIVDRNLDGRLSRRELSRLPRELAVIAGDSPEVTRNDIPTTVALLLGRGPFEDEAGPGHMLNSGPPWFFRADRNQDGDLDRAEFLGSNDEFDRLDVNGDGWIDLQEAVRGDALFGQ